MDDMPTVDTVVKNECFSSNHIKSEKDENVPMDDRKYLTESNIKNGIESNNAVSSITLLPNQGLTVPVSNQNLTTGHATVVAQIAPMTSVVRQPMEQANPSVEAVQAALILNKTGSAHLNPNQEVNLHEETAMSTSPVTVTVMPSAVTSNSSSSAVNSGSGRHTTNPDHIKRPMNAFLIWSTARRHKIKLEEPNITMAEISKRLGEEWKNMGHEERQPFVDQSKQLRAEHMAKYPDYKYQPRRRKPHSNSCANYSTSMGKMKTIKASPSPYPPSSTSGDLPFQQNIPQRQQPQQPQQAQIQGRQQQSQQQQQQPAHGLQAIHGATEHQLILANAQQTSVLSGHTLQQQSQQPQEHEHHQQQPALLIPHQALTVSNANNTAAQQQPQQQSLQTLNGCVLSANAVNGQQLNQLGQWPPTIYPGLNLIGYHMSNNGNLVPLYTPSQTMMPVLSLSTSSVGTVLQQANATSVAAAGQQIQQPPQHQQHQQPLPPPQQQQQQQTILAMAALSAADRRIIQNVQNVIVPLVGEDHRTSPSDSSPSSRGRGTSAETAAVNEEGGKDSTEPPGEVVPFAQM